MLRRVRVLALVLLACAAGCAARRPSVPGRAPFAFPDDAFAFANITVWEYDVDPSTGDIQWRPREPPPDFSLRCGTMARLARQFWANARFDPAAPPVVIPGYRSLHEFSATHRELLVRLMAGPWQSYLQRGNWRMIFPFPPGQQRDQAARLLDALAQGWPPVVHVLRYPRTTINHLVLVYAAEETPSEIRFQVYDPNDAEKTVMLTWDRAAELFNYSTTPYFPGGPVRAYEVYDGWLY